MTTAFDQLETRLQAQPHTWLVAGVAGSIGRNLLEALLKLNQRVVGLDGFATGHQRNRNEVQTLVSPAQWHNRVIAGEAQQSTDSGPMACHVVPPRNDEQNSVIITRTKAEPKLTNQAAVPESLHQESPTSSSRMGWTREITVQEMYKEMYANVLVFAKRHPLHQANEYQVKVNFELI